MGALVFDPDVMTASLALLLVVTALALLAVAGPYWGVDSRAPGGWTTSDHPAPLWPVDSDGSGGAPDRGRHR